MYLTEVFAITALQKNHILRYRQYFSILFTITYIGV